MQLIIPGDNVQDDPEIKAEFDVTNATDEQKKAFVDQCVQAYRITITEPNQLIWKTFQIYLLSQLQIPKYKFKSLQWRPMFNESNDNQINQT